MRPGAPLSPGLTKDDAHPGYTVHKKIRGIWRKLRPHRGSPQPTAAGIVFLAQEANVVAQAQQSIKQTVRFIPSLLQHIGIDQPEAAGQERPLAGRQSVRRGLCLLYTSDAADE